MELAVVWASGVSFSPADGAQPWQEARVGRAACSASGVGQSGPSISEIFTSCSKNDCLFPAIQRVTFSRSTQNGCW